jgi:hypothetical protein
MHNGFVKNGTLLIGLWLGSLGFAQREVIEDNSLSAGLETQALYEREPCGYRVTWIDWNSSFRASALKIGDRIVVINGQRVACPPLESDSVTPQMRTQAIQKFVQYGLGGLNEPITWQQQGQREGSSLILTVLRQEGDGDAALEIRGALRHARTYFSAEGVPMLSSTGPVGRERDGLNQTWSIWYEDFQRFLYRPFLDGWANRMDSRRLLTELLANQPRMELLAKKYPGAFEKSVRADYDRARAILEGEVVKITDADLEYRRLGEQRAAQVKTASKAAWESAQKSLGAQTIPAFPTANPLEQRAKVVGKVVVLPPINPRAWINEAGRCYLTSGNRAQGYYFIGCQHPAMARLFEAQFRYQRSVQPKLEENYAVIGRILDEPRLLVIGGEAQIGLVLEPLGVMIGDSVFVDLRVNKDNVSLFAAEDALKSKTLALPPVTASPRQVIETMIEAVKWGDESLWRKLFAESEVWVENGRIGYSTQRPTASMSDDWVRSRRLILESVFDARVAFVTAKQVLVTPQLIRGAPMVEEVRVEIRHIGRFDGAYRSFVNINVHPLWTLQRIDNGPWRIISAQGL